MPINFNFNGTIEKIFAGFKKITPALIAVSLATAVILFFPDSFIAKMYLLTFRNTYGHFIGVTFLISTTLIAVLIITTAAKKLSNIYYKQRFVRNGIISLHKLNKAEKSIVTRMYRQESRSLHLDISDSTTNLLVQKVIICRGSQISSEHSDYQFGFSHYLQPWVVDYIDKHKEFFK